MRKKISFKRPTKRRIVLSADKPKSKKSPKLKVPLSDHFENSLKKAGYKKRINPLLGDESAECFCLNRTCIEVWESCCAIYLSVANKWCFAKTFEIAQLRVDGEGLWFLGCCVKPELSIHRIEAESPVVTAKGKQGIFISPCASNDERFAGKCVIRVGRTKRLTKTKGLQVQLVNSVGSPVGFQVTMKDREQRFIRDGKR